MLSIVVLAMMLWATFLVARKNPANKFLAGVVIIIFNLLALETLSYGYLLYRIQKGCNFYMVGNQFLLDELIKINLFSRISDESKSSQVSFEIDNDLGYQPRPNKSSFQFKDTNIQRMRATRAYRFIPPEDKLRLAVFGDSFVYGDGELTPKTWPHMLEKEVGNLEVLNFGVSGYGLAQSYQRFINYGLRYNPDVVFFNYVETSDRDQTSALSILGGRELTNADLYRVNVEFKDDFLFFKAYNALDLFNEDFREKFLYAPLGVAAHSIPFSNRIFSVLNCGVVLKQWLAPQMFAQRHVVEKIPDLSINLRILRNILRITEFQQIKVIFFYGKDFQDLPPEIKDLLNQHSSHVVYVNSKKVLEKLFTFYGVQEKDLLNATNHYNGKGNKIYAEALKLTFKNQLWGRRDRIFKLDPETKSFVPASGGR